MTDQTDEELMFKPGEFIRVQDMTDPETVQRMIMISLRLTQRSAQNKIMREALEDLEALGGLGLTAHSTIRYALKAVDELEKK